MAETKPTAAKASTSVQPKKKSNAISWVAPLVCVIMGYIIWRFVLGSPSHFGVVKDSNWFWPTYEKPLAAIYKMYLGGIIVPLLIGALLTVLTFVIERFMTITKASGTGNNAEFIRKVQYHLANKNVQPIDVYKTGTKEWQRIELENQPLQLSDLREFAAVVAGKKAPDYSMEHDLIVQEALLRASGMK